MKTILPIRLSAVNLLMLFCSISILHAQENIDTNFKDKITYAFNGLDKNKVPHSLLLDYSMDFTNVEAYNGQLSDSTNLTASAYMNIYNTMLGSRVKDVTQGFVLPHVLANDWSRKRLANNQSPKTVSGINSFVPTIVLSALFYEYSKIRSNAMSQNDIAVQNSQYQDVYLNGQWQNPYENKKVFAVASQTLKIEGMSADFLLPSEIWLTNKPTNINKIEINASDGNGYRTLPLNQKVRVAYTSTSQEGVRDIIFRLTLNSGQQLLSRVVIHFGNPLLPGLQTEEVEEADNFEFISSTETYGGKKAYGILSIKYAAGRSEIRRPLIVAEGFDPGIITSPENIFGASDIDNFLASIRNSSSIALRNILTDNSTQEYDIIYVDWVNGVADMRRNAKLLKTVIAWVNAQKTANGSTEENVVLGQSMGGVIARYALREMEEDNTNHQTRLYISHDAPHQGANVPYGLQFLARHARNEYIKSPILLAGLEVIMPIVDFALDQSILNNIIFDIDVDWASPYAILTLADTPAAKQLLRNFVKRDYTFDSTAHNSFQNELQNKGYPQNYGIRNVAISNGSECGIGQEINPGDYIFRFYGNSRPAFFPTLLRMITDPLTGVVLNNPELFFAGLIPGHSKFEYDFWAKAVPITSVKQVYKGRVDYTKYLLFLLPIKVVMVNKALYAPSISLPIDSYAGGYYDLINEVNLDRLPGFLSDRITHLENFNFIPVSSALDVGEGQVSLESNDYTASYSAGSPPSAPRNIPFDNFITAINPITTINPNQAHISFEERNANWLAGELNEENNNIADCSFTCKVIEISGSAGLCSSGVYTIETGANVQWSASPSGLVNISNNGTSNVTISPASSSSRGEVTLTAFITSQECGSKTLTKEIYVGKPYATAPSVPTICINNREQTEYILPASQGATSYQLISSSPNLTINGTTNYSFTIAPTSIYFRSSVAGNYTVTIKTTNSCGTTTGYFPVKAEYCSTSKMSYSVYPNPASEDVFIEDVSFTSAQGAGYSQQSRLGKLYDFSGNLVKTIPLQAQAAITRMEVSSFKTGLYFLKIQVGEVEEVYKIIVAH